jgi:hypothetical protein
MKKASQYSQKLLKINTHLQIGYYTHDKGEPGEYLTDAESCNNKCMRERDARSWDCEFNYKTKWPQDVYKCMGENNGMMLDACMATCWPIDEVGVERKKGGKPYNSVSGEKCFYEFVDRGLNQGWDAAKNTEEWNRCLKTISLTW